MKLRKDRVIQTGYSNLDLRLSQKSNDLQYKSCVDLLSTAKSKKFDIHMKQKIQQQEEQQMNRSLELDKLTSKFPVNKSTFQNKREFQLEDHKLLQAFTGDSYLAFDRRVIEDKKDIFKYQKRERELEKQKKEELLKAQKREQQEQKIIEEKHKIHGEAIQETQLVGIEKTKETLEGKVDLDKIREIRQMLRRRYANQKNFQKIFNSWDEDSNGRISVKNIYNMIKKMGININVDEATVLVASANGGGRSELEMEEFMNLIFSDSVALNVNMKDIPMVSAEEINEILKGKMFAEQYQSQKLERHDKQLQMILKNKLANIQNLVKHEDSSQQGFINYERLSIILNKQGIPSTIMSDQDIKNIFNKYKIDEHKFNYKKFFNSLNEFKFVAEDISSLKQQEEKAMQGSLTTLQRQIKQFKKVESEIPGIHVQDNHRVDHWGLSNIRSKAKKAFNIIKRYFPKKTEFNTYLSAQLGLKCESDLIGKQITRDKLCTILENIFLNFGESGNLPKMDFEGFLSVFDYNKHNYTKAEEIGFRIFDEMDDEWEKKMQWKSKKPPPPEELNFVEEFPKIEKKSCPDNQEQNQQSPEKAEGDTKEQAPGEGKLPEADATQQTGSQNPVNAATTRKQETDQKSPDGKNKEEVTGSPQLQLSEGSPVLDQQNPDLKHILQKIDNHIFCGTKKAYEVFKQFDVDKDGYINHKDLVSTIRNANIMSNDEIKQLLEYVDPEQKGYVNFEDFSAKIRNGIQDNDNQGQQVTVVYQYPNKELTLKHNLSLPLINQKKQAYRKTMNTFSQTNFLRNTRFSANPPFQCTFVNFEPLSSSGMYMSDQDRYNRDPNHRIQFQKEEHELTTMKKQNKLQRIQQINNSIQANNLNKQQKQDIQLKNKNSTKQLNQWTYEHRAHLQNNWK